MATLKKTRLCNVLKLSIRGQAKMTDLQITARGLELSEPMKQYVSKKVRKLYRLGQDLQVYCEITNNRARFGVSNYIEMEISVSIPNAYIKVHRDGSSIFGLVDEIEPILRRQLKKHKEKHQKRHKIKWSEALLQS